MEQNTSTPLWLELRKEYIDDNFEALLLYLREKSTKTTSDAFYDTTLQLLRARVDDLVLALSTRPLYQEEESQETLRHEVRLLAAFLLADPGHPLALPAYLALTNQLRMLVPKFSDALVETAFQRLRHTDVAALGFAWNDVIDFKTEIFAYSVTKNSRFDNELQTTLSYQYNGTAYLTPQGLYLTSQPRAAALKLIGTGSNSLDTEMGVTIRTSSSDKLGQKYANDFKAIDKFLHGFIAQQHDHTAQQLKRLHPYSNGDELVVRVTDIDTAGNIHVETVDPKYEKICGRIAFTRPNIIYYYVSDIARYLQPGNYLRATVKDVTQGLFDIEKQFIEFVVEDCRENFGMGECVGKFIHKSYNSSVWINERGTPIYCNAPVNCNNGDYAVLEIREYRTGDQYGKINARIKELNPNMDGESLDKDELQKDCVIAFAHNTPVPSRAIQEADTLSPTVLRLSTQMLFGYQKQLLKPSERYRFLANARVMAETVGDDLAASYIEFAASYLRVLVQFAKGESIADISLKPEREYAHASDSLLRQSIVIVLKEYGKTEDSELLANTIRDFNADYPILARIARLIQTANSLQGTLSDASINVIKREIIRTLSLETENDTDLEADGGTYLGIESGTQEFKTSFVYPPDNNMQPSPTTQELNVFRGVCAFINSTTGGTLYLGVNDQGYITGIENDMRYLRTNTIDAYIRYIQDRAKHYFDTDGIVYLRIEPLYDNRVIAIHIEPHPFRVVELDGIAYLRINTESRIMPEKVKQELIARKVFKDENRAAAISLLQHACARQKAVILHKYSSSNSLQERDRSIEPYDVRPADGLVICYDKDDGKCKVFSLNRIGYVEVLDQGWTHQPSHKPMSIDAFHMSGETPIQVSLKLDTMAKNLLSEEYPATREDLVQDKRDKSIWYYNGKVFHIAALGRFYIGLAGHITILNCPELEAYTQAYLAENFRSNK